MAVHSFTCRECCITVTDTTTKGVHKCPKCGEDMWCEFAGSIRGNYPVPVHSDALAISPDQRAEHKREFPNIRLDGDYRPIFDNYVDHQAYLKKTGFVKATQKIKPKSN